METNPKAPIYDETHPKSRWVRRMFCFSMVLLFLTALTVAGAFACCRDSARAITLGFAALWAVGTPIWFFYEYFWLYREAAAPNSWEIFKYGQQLGVAIWAGLTVSLYALGSSDLAKPTEVRYDCSPVPVTTKEAPALLLSCKRHTT